MAEDPRVMTKTWQRIAGFARSVLPTPDLRVLLLGLSSLPMNVAFAVIVQRKERFDLDQALPWLHLADKLVFDFALFVACIGLLATLPLFPLWPILFVVAYQIVAGIDVFTYHCAHTVFEREYLEFTNGAYFGSFLGLDVAIFFATGLLGAIIAWSLLKKARPGLSLSASLRWGLVATVLGAVALPQRFCEVRASFLPHPAAYRSENGRLSYAGQNSVINFVDELLFHLPDEVHLLRELASHTDVLATYGLPLGQRDYPRLGLSFDRVILCAVESLSLDTLASYNPSLPEGVSPFYGSGRVQARMHRNHRTTQSPTLPGLLATFNSHPNAWMCAGAKSPLSFVKTLLGHGWETMLIRGDPKRFASGHTHFPNAGFLQDMAREDFDAAGADPSMTAEWGVTDRLLFDEAIERLKAARGRKIFVSVLTVDTHPWFGRVDYGNLALPQPPPALDSITDTGVREWLRSVFLHDHEMGRFFERLETEGLWDERTLVILTADHSCPRNPVTDELPDYPRTSFARIPLALLTPARLPELDLDAPSCQLDVAPTILHLLDLPVPPGYWGESLFVDRSGVPAVSVFREILTFDYGDRRTAINLNSGEPELQAIRELYGSILLGEGK